MYEGCILRVLHAGPTKPGLCVALFGRLMQRPQDTIFDARFTRSGTIARARLRALEVFTQAILLLPVFPGITMIVMGGIVSNWLDSLDARSANRTMRMLKWRLVLRRVREQRAGVIAWRRGASALRAIALKGSPPACSAASTSMLSTFVIVGLLLTHTTLAIT